MASEGVRSRRRGGGKKTSAMTLCFSDVSGSFWCLGREEGPEVREDVGTVKMSPHNQTLCPSLSPSLKTRNCPKQKKGGNGAVYIIRENQQ